MKRKRLIVAAGLLTAIIYVIGIITGFYMQKAMESQTKSTLAAMQNDLAKMRQSLENIQMEQLYLSSNEGPLGCQFLRSDITKIQDDLGFFLERLPRKLEVYVNETTLDQQYEQVKKDYMLISLRVWLLSKITKEKCGSETVPVIFFYSRQCPDCIRQGEELDLARGNVANLAIFTIDAGLDEPVVKAVKETYNITATPSLVAGNATFNRLVSAAELQELLR
ncbi:MAG: hypothetical protein HY519_04525 [Candidatus Aenigmarchaeota archaeon]|nr:hypothetical protein [Candidatus Aenigmarchaeota archaeon]